MNVLDLFSGIGGFSYGLELAGGFKTVAFCEYDKHCQKVIKKHWPSTPIFDDVANLTISDIDEKINIICGGFPCQDLSVGGRQKGILKGDRSSLWKEYWRLINEFRPEYAIIENVERLRKNGLGVVLNDLHKIGYDAEWHCITAASVGLPHQRDRLWIIAYPSGQRQYKRAREERHLQVDEKWEGKKVHSKWGQRESESGEVCSILSPRFFEIVRSSNASKESSLSSIRRVTNGLPEGLDERRRKQRIKQLGNAIVPQIAQLIGTAILEDNKYRNSNYMLC